MKPYDPSHPAVVDALAELRARNDELAIVPQNCYEYYVVATRPVPQNGLGLSSQQAIVDLAVFRFWTETVTKHAVLGKQAHDARLVAAMRRHQLFNLLTLNVTDFQRYPDIHVVDPRHV